MCKSWSKRLATSNQPFLELLISNGSGQDLSTAIIQHSFLQPANQNSGYHMSSCSFKMQRCSNRLSAQAWFWLIEPNPIQDHGPGLDGDISATKVARRRDFKNDVLNHVLLSTMFLSTLKMVTRINRFEWCWSWIFIVDVWIKQCRQVEACMDNFEQCAAVENQKQEHKANVFQLQYINMQKSKTGRWNRSGNNAFSVDICLVPSVFNALIP